MSDLFFTISSKDDNTETGVEDHATGFLTEKSFLLLKKVIVSENVSLFEAVQSCFAFWLAQKFGQLKLAFPCPFSLRENFGFRKTVGYMLNLVCLPFEFSSFDSSLVEVICTGKRIIRNVKSHFVASLLACGVFIFF